MARSTRAKGVCPGRTYACPAARATAEVPTRLDLVPVRGETPLAEQMLERPARQVVGIGARASSRRDDVVRVDVVAEAEDPRRRRHAASPASPMPGSAVRRR